MAAETLCPTELRNLLVTMLVGVTGADEDDWYDRIGLVEALPISLNPACNWRVAMTGPGDHRAFDHAVDILREVHPYVKA